jgi:uncharacterized protein (DUF111 family)
VKVARLGENEINIQPEYSACQKAAKKVNRPLREVMLLALKEFDKTTRSRKAHAGKAQRKKS